MPTNTLPSYQSPPVVEVVCGILFEPINGFTLPYLGRLWDRLPEEFVEATEVDPLAPVVETVGSSSASIQVDLSVLRIPRIWFVNRSGDEVIQIQRDRFLCNWRKLSPSHNYPRYDWIIERFRERLKIFQTFVTEAFQTAPQMRQYELSYINHIPADGAWSGLDTIGQVFPDLRWQKKAGRFLPTPERIEAQYSFALPHEAGRLHTRIQSAERQTDRSPVLVLDNTARGFLEDRDAWFDLAHEWIVKGFADLTAVDVQEGIWLREEG